ncbi:YceI family protein [Pseudorhodoferax sp.]|uniref:YceI family protein n=1 Tax=Pseudorhodoferax sp. TaxID=1993553 RepID=UPI0039E56FD3
MQKKFSTAFGAALLATTTVLALPAAAQQKLVPEQSEIAFVSRQMGVPVEGRFRKFDAQVAFDPARPAASKVAFTVDMGSVSLSPEANAELPKPVWFDVPKFPQATFQSSAVKALGGGKFEVAGKLAIKGVQQDVVVPMALAQNGASTVATGQFTIKRLAFKVGENEWADTSMVADDVQVRLRLTLAGVPKL